MGPAPETPAICSKALPHDPLPLHPQAPARGIHPGRVGRSAAVVAALAMAAGGEVVKARVNYPGLGLHGKIVEILWEGEAHHRGFSLGQCVQVEVKGYANTFLLPTENVRVVEMVEAAE